MNTSEAIKSYTKYCLAKGLRPRTIQWYNSILNLFALKYPTLPECPGDCEAFIMSCSGGDERRHGYFRTIRAFYNFLERRLGCINAVSGMAEPKRTKKLPRPLPIEQMVQLLSFPHPARIKGSLIFLTDTGVRVGELAKLDPDDFIETPWDVYLVKVDGKTGPRVIPASKESYNAIIKHLPFTIGVNYLSRIIARAFRDAHVPGSAHSLRHSFGTLWKGTDISLLQRIMGHANINTTMMYRLVQYEQLVEAHKLHSPLKLVLSQAGDIGII